MSSYAFKLTNGRTITINDGTLDSSQLPFTVGGRGAFNWIIALNESIMQTTESFYNIAQPKTPMQGQLFYNQPNDKTINISNDTLQVCVQNSGESSWGESITKFKYLVSMYKEASAPETIAKWSKNSHISFGDMWFDTKNNILKFYGTNGWISIKDENSEVDVFKLIKEDVPNRIVYICDKVQVTDNLLTIPALSFGDSRLTVKDITKSTTPDKITDDTIPTALWVTDRVKAYSGGVNTVYISANYTIDVNKINPASDEYRNGKLFCIKNLTDNSHTITFNGGKTADGKGTIIITKKQSLMFGAYNSQWYLL